MIVKTGGVVYKEDGFVWLKPYKMGMLFECIPACFIPEYPKRGNWLVYIDIPQGGSPIAYLFSSIEDYRLWDRLKGIKSLGPRKAASVLSAYPSNDLLKIIAFGDEETLASIRGIGKKTTRRIIAELRDEISMDVSEISEVKQVLISWGYEKRLVEKAFAKLYASGEIYENMDFDSILKRVIQVIDNETDSYTP